METTRHIWIIGFGRFGSLALDRLRQRFKSVHFSVVDLRADRLARIGHKGVNAVCADGIDYLVDHLHENGPPDRIVPCLPLHLAWEWLRRRLPRSGIIRPRPVPETFTSRLPHPYTGWDRAVYSSFADFICPDNCPEPANMCSVTRAPRPGNLFELLASAAPEDALSLVVRSHQMAPGVGGYGPNDLFTALARAKTADQTVILSTACRCHGVSHAFDPP